MKHAKTREEAAAKSEVSSQERGIATWMIRSCKSEDALTRKRWLRFSHSKNGVTILRSITMVITVQMMLQRKWHSLCQKIHLNKKKAVGFCQVEQKLVSSISNDYVKAPF